MAFLPPGTGRRDARDYGTGMQDAEGPEKARPGFLSRRRSFMDQHFPIFGTRAESATSLSRNGVPKCHPVDALYAASMPAVRAAEVNETSVVIGYDMRAEGSGPAKRQLQNQPPEVEHR